RDRRRLDQQGGRDRDRNGGLDLEHRRRRNVPVKRRERFANMRLQPLVLSVRESGRKAGCAQSSCPFCGVRFAEGQEPFLCPDGSADFSCAPCHLVCHLERDTIAEEAVLIWLPEMTQAALNALAHGALKRLARDGALDRAASPFA